MNAKAENETSILNHYIAARRPVSVWLAGGIRLIGIAKYQDPRTIVLQPLDAASPDNTLIIYKSAVASVGPMSCRQATQPDAGRRKLQTIRRALNQEKQL